MRCFNPQLSWIGKEVKDLQIKVRVRKFSLDVDRPTDWNQAKPFSQIPGPKSMPIIGNIWRFFPFIGQYYGLDRIALNTRLAEEYGKIVKLSDMKLRKDLVILFDPDDIQICYRNEGAWPRREGLGSVSYYRNKVRQDIFQGQGGVFTSHGEEWYQARSKLNQPLMQPRSAQMYIGPINEVAQDFMNCMRFLQNQHPQGEMPKDFSNDIHKWALESLGTITFNKRLGLLNPNIPCEPESQQLIDDILDFFNLTHKLDIKPSLWKWISTPNWKKYIKTQDRINNFSLKYINEIVKKLDMEKPQNELSILEQLLKKDKKLAFITVIDLLMTGIETAAKSVGAALYFLSKNQTAQEKLREECRKVLCQKDSPITKEMLNNMPYLKAVIKETIRLAPISIGILRRIPKDIILSGYQIPKGTAILNSHLYLSRQNKYFPQANDFIPERWLKQGGEEYQSVNNHPFVYLPFGFGPRTCIGKRFAQLEIEIILAKIVRNFSLSWPHEDMKWIMGTFYGIGSPLKFHVQSLHD